MDYIKDKALPLEIIGVLTKGKTPETCNACHLLYLDISGLYMCPFLGEEQKKFNERLDDMRYRPNWCPLETSLAQIMAKVMFNTKICEVVERKK